VADEPASNDRDKFRRWAVGHVDKRYSRFPVIAVHGESDIVAENRRTWFNFTDKDFEHCVRKEADDQSFLGPTHRLIKA